MNSRQALLQKSSRERWKISLQPVPAWTAILGLFFVILVGLLVGAAPILSLVFPLGSFAVGVFLYRKYPLLYVGFTWWLWFLAPLIKRLIDYRSGFGTFGNGSLSASLVTSISLVALWKHLPKYLANSSNRDGLPFIICVVSVFYAFIIGLIRQSITIDPRNILLPLMGWLAPIAFGFYLFINWRNYPSYRQNIQNIFFWGVVVMGIYGILQFLLVPDWDKFQFVLNSGGDDPNSGGWFGLLEPMKIRVWSTMSSPFDFSRIWVSGLILLMVKNGNSHFLISTLGYLVLFISRVRTGWYVWFLTVLYFSFSLRQGKQIRTILNVVGVLSIVLLLISTTSFSTDILEKFGTLFNLEDDSSFQGRFEGTADLMSYGLSNFWGVGLLQTSGVSVYGSDLIFHVVDNGYITLFLSLGWFGIVPYLSGLALIVAQLFQSYAGRSDVFFSAARAIVIGSLISILTTNISSGSGAINIWCFLGIAMAAHKYHCYQHTIQQKKS